MATFIRLIILGFIVCTGLVNAQTWTPCGSGLEHGANAMVTYNGELIVAGSIDSAGGQAVNSMAKWNGTNWMPFGGYGPDDGISDIIVYNGDLFVTGYFTIFDSVPANNIARWDGTAWNPCQTGTNDRVWALQEYNGSLYAGGDFDGIENLDAYYIARWDGTTWASCGIGANESVECLALYNGRLYASGYFDSVDNLAARYIDGWECVAGINDNTPGLNSCVYPNPSSGIFQISLNSQTPKEIRIYNPLGENIYNENLIPAKLE